MCVLFELKSKFILPCPKLDTSECVSSFEMHYSTELSDKNGGPFRSVARQILKSSKAKFKFHKNLSQKFQNHSLSKSLPYSVDLKE